MKKLTSFKSRNKILVIAILGSLSFISAPLFKSGSAFKRNPANVNSSTETYLGRSDYKLLFIDWTHRKHFNLYEDVLNPSPKYRMIEEYREAVLASAYQSLFPLMGQIGGQLTGTETNLFDSMLTLSNAAQEVLKKSLSSEQFQNAVYKGVPFPIVQEIVLAPYRTDKRDYFYRVEKLSTLGSRANVIGIDPTDVKFAKKLIEDTQAARAKASPNDPATLLGLRMIYSIDQRPGYENMNRIRLHMLLGLKPTPIPFSQTNDQVTLDRAVIPSVTPKNLASNGNLGPVANITLDLALSGAEAPTLEIEFGDLQSFEGGPNPLGNGFKVDPATQKQVCPRLEGIAKIKGKTTPIAINFSFQKMKFDLTKLQLSDLNLLTSPGLRINNHNYVAGGFAIDAVEKQFQGEINKTIEAELAKAKSGAEKKAEQMLLSNETVAKAVNLFLGARDQK